MRAAIPNLTSPKVARRINAIGVIETLADAMLFDGLPTYIRSDNGPEIVARALREPMAPPQNPERPDTLRIHLQNLDNRTKRFIIEPIHQMTGLTPRA